MDRLHIPHWLQVVLAASGGLGLFVVGVVDSAFLPLPVISDALTIGLCADNPLRMPYYALMSTAGSVIGCMLLYYFVRRGEEAFLSKYEGERVARVRHWLKSNGFITTLIGALMPPPTPFKIIVVGAGALKMPAKSFFLAILIARSIRFFGEGYLAARYGPQAYVFLSTHKLSMGLVSVGIVTLLYIVVRLTTHVRKGSK